MVTSIFQNVKVPSFSDLEVSQSKSVSKNPEQKSETESKVNKETSAKGKQTKIEKLIVYIFCKVNFSTAIWPVKDSTLITSF